MKKRLAFGLVAIGLALLACGGTVDGGDPSKVADCPSDAFYGNACSNSGQKCRRSTNWCGNTYQDTCTCVNARWSCEVNGGPACFDASRPPGNPPRETCGFAGAVTDGELCYPEEKGATCNRFGDGCITSDTCTCDGAKFVCTHSSPSCDAGVDAPADAGEGG